MRERAVEAAFRVTGRELTRNGDRTAAPVHAHTFSCAWAAGRQA